MPRTQEQKREYNRQWRLANREKRIEYYKRYREENREKIKAYYEDPATKLRVSANSRRRKYGLTEEQFNQMLEKQENKCAICRKVFDDRKHTHVDHNHTTGKVRALLCNQCNLAVGHLQDDPTLCFAAGAYLTSWE